MANTPSWDGRTHSHAEYPVGLDRATSRIGPKIAWTGGVPTAINWTAARGFQLILKRLMDVVGALALLAGFAPLFVVLAIAISLDSPGPAFFVQAREGRGGQLFKTFKFRTMYAEQDGRVTRLGTWLRRTSLDELPQLFNVLLGDMSLVGPRPHVRQMHAAALPYRALVPYYDYRLQMKPGMTGWAQANSLRGPTMERQPAIERIEHDVAYIQNFSLALDIRILIRTALREFLRGTGT